MAKIVASGNDLTLTFSLLIGFLPAIHYNLFIHLKNALRLPDKDLRQRRNVISLLTQ